MVETKSILAGIGVFFVSGWLVLCLHEGVHYLWRTWVLNPRIPTHVVIHFPGQVDPLFLNAAPTKSQGFFRVGRWFIAGPFLEGVNLPRLPDVLRDGATSVRVLPYYLLPGLVCGVAATVCAGVVQPFWICAPLTVQLLAGGFLQWLPMEAGSDGSRMMLIFAGKGMNPIAAKRACYLMAGISSLAVLIIFQRHWVGL